VTSGVHESQGQRLRKASKAIYTELQGLLVNRSLLIRQMLHMKPLSPYSPWNHNDLLVSRFVIHPYLTRPSIKEIQKLELIVSANNTTRRPSRLTPDGALSPPSLYSLSAPPSVKYDGNSHRGIPGLLEQVDPISIGIGPSSPVSSYSDPTYKVQLVTNLT
jgi:hypothetical protein